MDWTVKAQNGIFTTELKEVSCFRSIPYAESTAGKNRWNYPLPKEYQGEKEVKEMGNICPQETRGYPKGEDCLNLTIWTKKGWKKKPVFLFIHGGSFVAGSSQDPNLDGEILVDREEFVMVSINYRLGVFGFVDFSFLGEEFKRNPGFYDAAEALRWVYHNIEAFGGDPKKIVIAGQSAGGTIVSALLTVEEINKYIYKAVILSGVPTGIHTCEASEEVGRKYLEYMNITTKEELRNLTQRQIADSQMPFSKKTGYGINTYQLAIDNYYIKEPPIQAIDNIVKRIPLLMGSTKGEIDSIKYPYILDQWNLKDTLSYLKKLEEGSRKERNKLYWKKYGLKWKDHYYSDLVIRIPGIWYGEKYSEKNPLWYYRFDYVWTLPLLGLMGAYHSSELNYLFSSYDWILGGKFRLPWDKKNGDIVSRNFQNIIGDFVYDRKLKWNPWEEDFPYLSIGKKQKELYFSKKIIDSWKTGGYYKIAHDPNVCSNTSAMLK